MRILHSNRSIVHSLAHLRLKYSARVLKMKRAKSIRPFNQPRMKKVSAAKSPAYKNSALPAEKRVKDLLKRMTLPEKAAQMMCVWQEQGQKLVDDWGQFEQCYL